MELMGFTEHSKLSRPFFSSAPILNFGSSISGGSRIFQTRRCQSLSWGHQPIILAIISQKLHENESNMRCKGKAHVCTFEVGWFVKDFFLKGENDSTKPTDNKGKSWRFHGFISEIQHKFKNLIIFTYFYLHWKQRYT